MLRSFVPEGVVPAAVGALFDAAAALYRLDPWRLLTAGERVFQVSSLSLGLTDARIGLVDEDGMRGLVVLPEPPDLDASLDDPDHTPTNLTLAFQRGAELPSELRKEVVEHQWEVADPEAFPRLGVIDGGASARDPAPREIEQMEAVVRVLVELLADLPALRAAHEDGEDYQLDAAIQTHDARHLIAIVSALDDDADDVSVVDAFAALGALTRPGEPLDHDLRHALEAPVLAALERAPEGHGLEDSGWVETFFELGARHLRVTAPHFVPERVRALLFELIPASIQVPPDEAEALVAQLRAYFAFAGRELAWAPAAACLELLGADAVARISAGPPARRPDPTMTRKNKQKARDKRKSERQARKKNR